MRRPLKKKGSETVENLIVIAILGALAVTALGAISGQMKSQTNQTNSAMAQNLLLAANNQGLDISTPVNDGSGTNSGSSTGASGGHYVSEQVQVGTQTVQQQYVVTPGHYIFPPPHKVCEWRFSTYQCVNWATDPIYVSPVYGTKNVDVPVYKTIEVWQPN